LTIAIDYVSLTSALFAIRLYFKGDTMREKIEEILNKIRPTLQADGGDVQLVDVKDGIVSVKLTGHCAGCPMSTMTLRMGIERILKEQVPEVKEVVAVN
jgi:Fe-S cluster biogenesis protein NfuA